MTLRQIMFIAVQAFLCALLWRVSPLDTQTAKELADTLPWAIVVLMMVPLARFKSGDVLTALKTWRGGNTSDRSAL